jgi:hypothetical protein
MMANDVSASNNKAMIVSAIMFFFCTDSIPSSRFDDPHR